MKKQHKPKSSDSLKLLNVLVCYAQVGIKKIDKLRTGVSKNEKNN